MREKLRPTRLKGRENRQDLADWLGKSQQKCRRLCAWVEKNLDETLTFFRLPLVHRKDMKSTNMLERLNQEIERRTHVARLSPNEARCLRIVRTPVVEIHEGWLEGTRNLDWERLREMKKEKLPTAA